MSTTAVHADVQTLEFQASHDALSSREVVAPFHLFKVQVERIEHISPNFKRIAFVGEDIADWAHGGRDQRIKVVLPAADGSLPYHLLPVADWYTPWREMSDEQRAPIRTYTGRAYNYARETLHGAEEVVVDFVLHGDSGPASSWVSRARVGSEILLVGPSVRGGGRELGIEFQPPRAARRIILAGDETAAPAICSIIEDIARSGALEGRDPVDVRAFIEVPTDADRLPCAVTAHPRVKVTWLDRNDTAHGELLIPAVESTVTGRLLHECSLMCSRGGCVSTIADLAQGGNQTELVDVDVDTDILWDVQPVSDDNDGPSCYAWIAGEAGVVKTLRRHLVSDLGMDRRAVAFMGYWRTGRSEN